jgi:hypothetical protein
VEELQKNRKTAELRTAKIMTCPLKSANAQTDGTYQNRPD